MDLERSEAKRDQVESAFTPILRRLFQQMPNMLAAVFVDAEGECIDYVSALDPYEAKVGAAHLHMLMRQLRALRANFVTGEPFELEITTTLRELWVRRLGGEYLLISVLLPGFDRTDLRDALVFADHEFRAEVGLAPPSWETVPQRLSVRVRASPGWKYAPQGFSSDGMRVTITDVLGRWTEPAPLEGEELVCFRVRTQEGQELTLVHDPDGEGWLVRD
jgi:hypothetical protein